jgi:exodeoxyribonuclease V alpha subunit
MQVVRRNIKNPLAQDVILVDEAAMIASDLYRNLIDAMKPNSYIRFFGDVNQLQPIEIKPKEKSSFQLLLENAAVNSIRLDEIFRQAGGSSITTNGARIIKGQPPIPSADFAIKSVNVPRHKHEAKFTGEHVLYINIGAKVILNSNIYDLRPTIEERYLGEVYMAPQAHEQVFNGEAGIVVDLSNNAVTIDVGDRVITIPEWLEIKTKAGLVTAIDPRMDIDLAYAITCHKAQGSEYKNVLYFVSSSGAFNQCRANFYTGITRAREAVCLVGDHRSLSYYSLRREPSVWNKTT